MKLIGLHAIQRMRGRLRRLYGRRCDSLVERLYMVIGRYNVGLNPVESGERWSQRDAVLIAYADMVSGPGEAPLRTLHHFLNLHLHGVVNSVHILPFYPWSSDDGFSVIDYRQVKEEYGTWREVKALGGDYKLMFDLVLNHCSAKSAWFKDFVNGISPARDYFHVVGPDTNLTKVTRPRPTPVLTKKQTRNGAAHVWTTFSEDQVDLDFGNPDVLFEFIDILLLYISMGAKLIRLDAVAFLWKKIGTTCLHLPETHEVVKLLHDLLKVVAPEVILLTETNVPHEENISYFGRRGGEAHMVYQFSLPPLLLHGLLRNDCAAIRQWAADLAPPPKGCTFFNFTASHDGIGVRPLQGLVPQSELDWLVKAVRKRGGKVNMRQLPDGGETPYELNITYFSVLSDEDNPALGEDRFLCSQAVALAMRGIPGVYFNSLIGAPNWSEGVETTGHNRTINRQKWSFDSLNSALENPEARECRVFTRLAAMLRRRQEHPAFHPDGEQAVIDLGNALFAFTRTAPDRGEEVFCVFNFTGKTQLLPGKALPDGLTAHNAFDIIELAPCKCTKGQILFAPYQAQWIVAR